MTAPLADAQKGEHYLANDGRARPIKLVIVDLDDGLAVSWDYSILGYIKDWPGFRGNWTYTKVER